MRSELLELERQKAAELMGYDAWAAMQRSEAASRRRKEIIRAQERRIINERIEPVPDRREY